MGKLPMIFIIVMIVLVIVITLISRKKKPQSLNLDHMQEDSFQRYAKFFGDVVPTDDEYILKLNKIYTLIEKDKETSLTEIAKKSNCSTKEECALKIRYLKNKRMLGDYYVDAIHDEIIMCSEEDQKLLDKYKPFIYHSHLQIDEMANMLPNKEYLDIKQLRQKVYEELTYLDKKNLLNGLRIDDIDRKIIYYTIEKRKRNEGYETVHCPNCGALNDVEVNGKVRCDYCKTIVKGSEA